MPAPDLRAASRDLSDAELRELDALLTALPEPLVPMDVVMLDGYLCGVIVQPALIGADAWLPPVFDIESRPPPAGDAGVERIRALVLRRHAALNRALLEDGGFDPLIFESQEDDGAPAQEQAAGEAQDAAQASPATAADLASDPFAELPAVSRPIAPWVAGFEAACMSFPDLFDSTDDAVAAALARIMRHLPPDNDEEREIVAMLDRDLPLVSLDEAIDELVAAVADLAGLTHDERYRVATVRRDAPKVGRNDACPCGSGRKFKHCHGAG